MRARGGNRDSGTASAKRHRPSHRIASALPAGVLWGARLDAKNNNLMVASA